MSGLGRMSIFFTLCLAFMLVGTAMAQDTSTTSTAQSGQPTMATEVKSGEVVYVSGNDLVVKLDDGQVRHVVVPDTTTVNVDGKDLTVHDLKPGMHLSRTITTTSTPTTVTTVRTIKGKVWHVNPPNTVILTLADGTNKQYKVPKGQMFEMDGEKHDVFDLRQGMVISANVVTEVPEDVQTSSRSVTGTPAPETPPAEAVLLIEEPTPAEPAQPQAAESAQRQEVAQSTAAALPQTASPVPLVGLLGLLSVGMGLGIRAFRRRS
jgi:hypothetical protein